MNLRVFDELGQEEKRLVKLGMPQKSGEIHYSALTVQATGLSLPNR